MQVPGPVRVTTGLCYELRDMSKHLSGVIRRLRSVINQLGEAINCN
jgi:hypothetical protein